MEAERTALEKEEKEEERGIADHRSRANRNGHR